MIRTEVLERVGAYLTGRINLQSLAEMADDYDWDESARTSMLEWQVVGTIALYVHEIAEGLRDEASLREALAAFELSPTIETLAGDLAQRPRSDAASDNLIAAYEGWAQSAPGVALELSNPLYELERVLV